MIRVLLLLLLWLQWVQPVFAGLIQNPEVSGHLKTFDLSYMHPPGTPLADGFFSANDLRLQWKGNLNAATELEFAVDNLLLYSDHPSQLALPLDSPNQRVSLSQDWNRGENWSNRLGIDRLALKGRSTLFDWSVGRQAIGFGRIVLFSPLDVVAPFAPDSLDTDTRPGVDALRAVHYFGLGGQVGGTIVLGSQPDNNSYLLTLSKNQSGIDLLGIGGSLRERRLLGIGLAGSLGPLGIKGEITHYQGKETAFPAGDLHDDFAIGAVELWYRFDSGIVLLTEYLYNGAGGNSPNDYPATAASAAFREGISPLLGQQYLLLAPSWEVHPLLTLSGLMIRNLKDNSMLLRPQAQISLNDNINLELFYSFNFGAKSRVLVPSISIPQSEFGAAGDSGGLLLRWYF
ncbi:hypothetical protein [Geopsychrobacter electrodiphilus]|uniref:hypothetical protein n=1 Tax=Geopsychrobacter electrodiphilus TaxID=225196 RepID=UPI000368E4FF|nr:hypothetical protein [Geopsychrobacter electrodiphilus]